MLFRSIGEIGDIADSNDAVEKTDILNELDNNFLPVSASDSKGHGASYSNEFGPIELVADVYTESSEDKDNKYGISVNYGAEIFSVGAMYQTWGDQADVKGISSIAVAADVTPIDALTFAGTYNIAKADDTDDVTSFTLSASFDATEQATVYGVYGAQDDDSSVNPSEIILGAQYEASDLLTVFTEVALRDADVADTTKTEYLLGAYFDF